MTTKVSFADLTHTGQLIAANTFPLGISMVAAYAKQELKDEIEAEIFKYPDDLSQYLETNAPRIACFSNFSWNLKLGHEYARRIKLFSPKTITLFGGPNFPGATDEQEEFLRNYPAIDCYVEFEGEVSFVELFKALKKADFNWKEFKRAGTVVPNLRYLHNGKMVAFDVAPKVNVQLLPSPYEGGLMDKFFDEILIPMMQTTRGCPFSCAFCWEGGDYFMKTTRFPQERIVMELRYIAERVRVPDLCIVDANFGMFKQDIETAQEILAVQRTHAWPKTVLAATAKNHKERTGEIVKMLGATLPPTAAVQSTDDEVLDLIRRKNVSQDALINLAKTVEEVGGQSEAEMILCLEGDTKEKHFKTVFDMLDADMTFLRMYQFMMLPGTQSASKETRKKFEMNTRYRVLPRCFGTYTIRGETFPAAEIEEICIANNTMPYEAYQDCRDLNLTVEVFHNDSIFAELQKFLRRYNVSRSEFIKECHKRAFGNPVLRKLYTDLREEEKKNLSENRQVLEEFTRRPGVIQRYIEGEYGTNELYKYRVIAVFEDIELLHEIAFGVARFLMERQDSLDGAVGEYLSELHKFSLMRKRNPLDTDLSTTYKFHYDFVQLMDNKFLDDPFKARTAEGVEVEFYHSDQQIDLINSYAKQYGTDLIGLGRIVLRANMNRLYRSARRLDMKDDLGTQGELGSNRRSKLQLIA